LTEYEENDTGAIKRIFDAYYGHWNLI
jgi:hypothetical protein